MASLNQAFIVSFFNALAATAPANLPTRQSSPPAEFDANNNIGPGGSTFIDSPHFRVYGASGTEDTLSMLEAAYSCFVDTLGWRSSGLSFNDDSDSGPYTKVNVYSVDSLSGGAAGVMHSDYATGMSWLEVVNDYLNVPGVTVHEYGHGLTYHAQTWVDQTATGAWWETVANFVADTYKTSPLCEEARSANGQSTGNTEIVLQKIIGDSFQVLVDGTAGSGNYYEQWPFLSFLTYNPDDFAGLGRDAMWESFAQYDQGSNETPLHTFARLLENGNASIQQVVGRYWARMAFVDIGHPTAQDVFDAQRQQINYDNLDSNGRVLSERAPRYMGANIIPLTVSGSSVAAQIETSGSATATLVVRGADGNTRYVDFENGYAEAEVASGEEAAVVVANTPELIQYDAFDLSSEVNTGMDYTLSLTGASF